MNGPGFLAIVLVSLALACYRAQRIVTSDVWPPTAAFRQWMRERAVRARDQRRAVAVVRWQWAHKLMTCPWCFGTWLSFAGVVLTHAYVVDLMTGEVHNRAGVVAIFAAAAATIVGWIGEKE